MCGLRHSVIVFVMLPLQAMIHPDPRRRLTAAEILAHPSLDGVPSIPAKFRTGIVASGSVGPAAMSHAELLEKVRCVLRVRSFRKLGSRFHVTYLGRMTEGLLRLPSS